MPNDFRQSDSPLKTMNDKTDRQTDTNSTNHIIPALRAPGDKNSQHS